MILLRVTLFRMQGEADAGDAPETFEVKKVTKRKVTRLQERLPVDRRATSRTSYSCSFHCSETLIKEPIRKMQK